MLNFKHEMLHDFHQRMGKILIAIAFLIHGMSAFSQDFVKKDSSDIIPFIAKIYYSTDLDSLRPIAPKIRQNHILSPISPCNENLLTGNLGSPLLSVLHQPSFYQQLRLGRSRLYPYFYSAENVPYFSLNKPLSELDFIFFGNSNELFQGFLSQNLSSRFHIGVGIKKLSNKGYFLKQENEHNNLYAYIVYQHKQWRSNLEVIYNDASLKESGGYVSDVYDGSVTLGLWKAVNPKFSNALNQFKNYQISLRNRFLITPIDTNQLDSVLFIPKKGTFFIDHEAQFSSERLYYQDVIDSISKPEYGIYGTSTNLRSKYLNERYSSDFSLNYRTKYLSLKGYNYTAINQIYTSNSFSTNFLFDENILFGIGGDIQLNFAPNWTYQGHIYKSFSGYTQQDLQISSSLRTRLNSWDIAIHSSYQRQMLGYIYHYAQSSATNLNYDLATQNTLENSLTISYPKKNFLLKAQYFNIENFLLFDSSLQPYQVQNNFYQIYTRKEWRFKSLYFPTTILYQNSILPKGMFKQTLAYHNKFFSDKNNVYIGADLSLNIDFLSAQYSPYLMQEIYPTTAKKAELYPKLDIFATFKISKVHVSLVMDNFLSTYLRSGISYLAYHPITPSAFYFRANWVFLE